MLKGTKPELPMGTSGILPGYTCIYISSMGILPGYICKSSMGNQTGYYIYVCIWQKTVLTKPGLLHQDTWVIAFCMPATFGNTLQ